MALKLRIFRNLSAQRSRRSLDIHFKRYQQDSSQDLREFVKVMKSLQDRMPIDETPNLLEHAEYIYIGTLGCIGILKNWLTRAFKKALEECATTVTIEHLEKHILPVDTLENMLREINEGEKLFEKTDSDRNRLRMALGFDPIASLTSNDSAAEPVTPSSEQAPVKKPTRKRRVGQRNPKRDPVGSESNAS